MYFLLYLPDPAERFKIRKQLGKVAKSIVASVEEVVGNLRGISC